MNKTTCFFDVSTKMHTLITPLYLTELLQSVHAGVTYLNSDYYLKFEQKGL